MDQSGQLGHLFGRLWRRTGRGFLLPLLCPACLAAAVPEPERPCADCAERLRPLPEPRCPGCGGALDGVLARCGECLAAEPRPWDWAVSAFAFAGTVRELVHRFKYQGHAYLARLLGQALTDAWQRHGQAAPEAVVPVPLHWLKEWLRGYNQAALLGAALARATGTPLVHALRRRRWTRQQARLGLDERRRNVRTVFAVRDTPAVRGRRVLLVDDVMTTGATLGEAGSALRRAGAAWIGVVTVARG
jgi:ComF family protein